jgi:hypothetical protein
MHETLILRSRRKTIALVVKPDGSLLVRAPWHATRAQIEAVVTEHTGWIQKQQVQAHQRLAKHPTHQYAPGEQFLYLGNAYPLEIVTRQKAALLFSDRFYLASQRQAQARQLFTRWYRQQAQAILPERVERYAAQYGFQYQRVKISSARTRWGSCSARGSLSFTWRLAMAPVEVIDYVVVHELAHLRVRNHGREFWALVGAMVPEFKQRIAWLKENGPGMVL